jgi:hypothetical protein
LISPFCIFVSGSDLDIPNAPIGPRLCDINIIYTYFIDNIDVGSSWMFYWGDGNFSDWISVGSNDEQISQTYSWSSYGTYKIRVKNRIEINLESPWSNPLTVIVEPLSDTDGDGFKNELEASYGTNISDADDYPVDTDRDGVPDHDSEDMLYIGDLDDDNDGVNDLVEKIIGSDSKITNYFSFISIKGTSYILANIDNEQDFEVLYNLMTHEVNNIKTINGKSYLDINGDKIYDYIYYQGSISPSEEPFELPWLYIIIAVICTIVFVIFILFKTGILYLYQEEIYVDE